MVAAGPLLPAAPAVGFRRDRLTWLQYLMLGYFGYLINGIGPSLSGLRADLGIGYGVAGLHSSLFAVGIIFAGVGGERVAARLGRRRTFWLAATAMAVGAWVFALGRSLILTLPAALAMGTIGSLLIILIPAVLSDRHGTRRSTAFAESNAVSSAFGAVAPLLIGLAILAGLGWGPGLALPPTILLVAMAIAFGRTRFPRAGRRDDASSAEAGESAAVAEADGGSATVEGRSVTPDGRAASASGPVAEEAAPPLRGGLEPEFWRHWLTLVLVVAVEFCMIYWAADYLRSDVGLSPAAAAASVAVFLGGMVVGRLVGGRFALRSAPDRLLVRALLLAAIGFAVFWSTGLPAPSVTGLALTGLGVAMLYPLALALAVGAAAAAPDLASARAALGSGLAITIAPLVLAWSADVVGIRLAYLVVPILLAAAYATVRVVHR